MILFYAPWCPFCQRFLPVFEKHAERHPDSCFSASTDELDDCEEEYSVKVVPTVIFFEKGKLVKRLDGAPGQGLTEKQLVELMADCGLK